MLLLVALVGLSRGLLMTTHRQWRLIFSLLFRQQIQLPPVRQLTHVLHFLQTYLTQATSISWRAAVGLQTIRRSPTIVRILELIMSTNSADASTSSARVSTSPKAAPSSTTTTTSCQLRLRAILRDICSPLIAVARTTIAFCSTRISAEANS